MARPVREEFLTWLLQDGLEPEVDLLGPVEWGTLRLLAAVPSYSGFDDRTLAVAAKEPGLPVGRRARLFVEARAGSDLVALMDDPATAEKAIPELWHVRTAGLARYLAAHPAIPAQERARLAVSGLEVGRERLVGRDLVDAMLGEPDTRETALDALEEEAEASLFCSGSTRRLVPYLDLLEAEGRIGRRERVELLVAGLADDPHEASARLRDLLGRPSERPLVRNLLRQALEISDRESWASKKPSPSAGLLLAEVEEIPPHVLVQALEAAFGSSGTAGLAVQVAASRLEKDEGTLRPLFLALVRDSEGHRRGQWASVLSARRPPNAGQQVEAVASPAVGAALAPSPQPATHTSVQVVPPQVLDPEIPAAERGRFFVDMLKTDGGARALLPHLVGLQANPVLLEAQASTLEVSGSLPLCLSWDGTTRQEYWDATELSGELRLHVALCHPDIPIESLRDLGRSAPGVLARALSGLVPPSAGRAAKVALLAETPGLQVQARAVEAALEVREDGDAAWQELDGLLRDPHSREETMEVLRKAQLWEAVQAGSLPGVLPLLALLLREEDPSGIALRSVAPWMRARSIGITLLDHPTLAPFAERAAQKDLAEYEADADVLAMLWSRGRLPLDEALRYVVHKLGAYERHERIPFLAVMGLWLAHPDTRRQALEALREITRQELNSAREGLAAELLACDAALDPSERLGYVVRVANRQISLSSLADIVEALVPHVDSFEVEETCRRELAAYEKDFQEGIAGLLLARALAVTAASDEVALYWAMKAMCCNDEWVRSGTRLFVARKLRRPATARRTRVALELAIGRCDWSGMEAEFLLARSETMPIEVRARAVVAGRHFGILRELLEGHGLGLLALLDAGGEDEYLDWALMVALFEQGNVPPEPLARAAVERLRSDPPPTEVVNVVRSLLASGAWGPWMERELRLGLRDEEGLQVPCLLLLHEQRRLPIPEAAALAVANLRTDGHRQRPQRMLESLLAEADSRAVVIQALESAVESNARVRARAALILSRLPERPPYLRVRDLVFHLRNSGEDEVEFHRLAAAMLSDPATRPLLHRALLEALDDLDYGARARAALKRAGLLPEEEATR